jgi:hypothetical protein
MRLILAFQVFFAVLFGRALPEAVVPKALPPAPPPPPEKPREVVVKEVQIKVERDPAHGALQLLGLLQKEARLVDFLREEIASYDDASIGAAVRDIHKGAKKVLEEHFAVEAVMDGAEGDSVKVPAGFDAHHIRLTGNVAGNPPFSGVLRHHGWRAGKVELPKTNEGADLTVLAPAEVELA